MAKFDVFHRYADELEKRIRLQTFPIALKLLEQESDIPNGSERPLRDFGYHVALCQSFSMARREGRTIAILKEDMWCFEPAIGYGLAEAPQYFLDGYNRYPQDVQELGAGRNYASDFPRFEVGRYIGVVSAPLSTVNFEPDIVLIYCNSAQLTLLLLGRECQDGHDLKCSLSSHAACVYAVVPAIKKGECQAAIPCRGDRTLALARDDEIIFSVPAPKFKDLMSGLSYVEQYGSKLPFAPQMRWEPDLPESYSHISDIMGLGRK